MSQRKPTNVRELADALMDAYAEVERDATACLLAVSASVLRLREANRELRLALIKTRKELLDADKERLAAITADTNEEVTK